jgi:REP element-mobilizing transposase RayT
MARRHRANEPGDMHHVFTRGVERSAVAVDASDYDRATRLLAAAVERFDLRCHSWCFMSNHIHLMVTSPLGNLSVAMGWYCGQLAQTFNHRHGRIGHLFQGRFGSRRIEDDTHLLELARYIPLNPVRAGLCRSPDGWAWSSYAVTAGLRPPLAVLDPRPIFAALGPSQDFAGWVAGGLESVYLDAAGAPQRPPLDGLLTDDSDGPLAAAHFTHGHTIAEIARHLGADRSRISRRMKQLAPPARTGSDPDRAHT